MTILAIENGNKRATTSTNVVATSRRALLLLVASLAMMAGTSFYLRAVHRWDRFSRRRIRLVCRLDAPGAQDTMMVLALALHLDPVYVGASSCPLPRGDVFHGGRRAARLKDAPGAAK